MEQSANKMKIQILSKRMQTIFRSARKLIRYKNSLTIRLKWTSRKSEEVVDDKEHEQICKNQIRNKWMADSVNQNPWNGWV